MNKKPFMFVTFRKHKQTNVIYAVFNQTLDINTECIQTYSEDHHEMATLNWLRNETKKASMNECNELLQRIKDIYETEIDGVAGIIKPVSFLPIHIRV